MSLTCSTVTRLKERTKHLRDGYSEGVWKRHASTSDPRSAACLLEDEVQYVARVCFPRASLSPPRTTQRRSLLNIALWDCKDWWGEGEEGGAWVERHWRRGEGVHIGKTPSPHDFLQAHSIFYQHKNSFYILNGVNSCVVAYWLLLWWSGEAAVPICIFYGKLEMQISYYHDCTYFWGK